ncbi:WD repeat-containing protein 75-like isoform X2 [Dreissena polymorpha]|uniref:WD repeat-containing protein 75-like isoform X2 n=1 Tax=Dreissena polymorpha TaxID=45954 RepID=UPI002264FC32|nr:WD repeat-containing protein 75-like isoform X2 [Dreissena polymorpha]
MAAPIENMFTETSMYSSDDTIRKEDKIYFPIKSGASLVKAKPIFSNDDKYLFVCSGSAVKVFSTESGLCVRELCGHTSYVTGLVLHPKNKLQVISCSLDTEVIIWDYEDGVLLRRVRALGPVHGIYTVEGRPSVYLLLQNALSGYNLCEMTLDKNTSSTSSSATTTLLHNCNSSPDNVAVGPKGFFCVTTIEGELFVKNLAAKKQKIITHRLEEGQEFTCVACHPNGHCLATGCKDGRILLWYKFLEPQSAVRSQLHWHALPVLDLAFTAEGSYLLSGGHECVLVKWHMDSGYKDFLPRLGSPINHVTCSHDNQLYATCHTENVIQVISSTFTIKQVYQGLTRTHNLHGPHHPCPTGLLCDPRSGALVLNGKHGHLQFYSVHADRQMYNLDIVCQNFISAENLDRPLVVTDVTCAAFDDTGTWLATVEYWNDDIITPEITLKFWFFDEEKQSYVLNTTVEAPHVEAVHTLKMRPGSGVKGSQAMAVTASNDGKFKLWRVTDDTDIYRSNTKWTCESVGFYRDLAAGSVEFSDDGSLLAVVFGPCITLWEPDNNLLRHTLVSNTSSHCVKHVMFGRHGCSQYLLSTTQNTLTVWSLITCGILWTVDISVQCVAQDPLSDVVALFTANKDLFVFRPSDPTPLFSHVAVSKSAVASAAFIPHTKKSHYRGTTLSWQAQSELYFMNNDQELITVALNDTTKTARNKQDVVQFESNLPRSALSLLMSHHRNKSGSKVNTEKVTRQPTGKFLRELFSSACHVQPSVKSLCRPFIQSLLIPSAQFSKEQRDSDSDEDEEEETALYHSQTVSQDSGLDSDMDVEISVNQSDSGKDSDASDTDSGMRRNNVKQHVFKQSGSTKLPLVSMVSDKTVSSVDTTDTDLDENVDWIN